MSDSTQINTRRAALMLHAMQPADRAWVLQNTPHGQSAQLQTLLEELRSLGIPADPSLLTEPMAARRKMPPIEEEKFEKSELRTASELDRNHRSLDEHSLDTARVDILLATLKLEPAALIARLLSLRAWRWRDDFLNAMSAEQRHAVHQCMERQATVGLSNRAENAALLQQALIDGVFQRYTQAVASCQPSSLSNKSSIGPDLDTSLRTGFLQAIGVWCERIVLRWRNLPSIAKVAS